MAPDDQRDPRAAALRPYRVLDTPRETAFDEIAELAASICETPVAIVNLVEGDRQFFKAEVGLGVRATPLETSFCAHALLESDFLLVPDTAQDPRFACNPLVIGDPHFRFYAGALLKTPDGVAIGTLCVLDYRPRTLTDVQQRTIRVLARQVMAQLEQRRVLETAALSEARQRAIVDSAREVAVIATGLDGTILDWSRGAEEVFGWSEAEAVGQSAALIFTREDRAAGVPASAMRRAVAQGRVADERWHVRKDGGHVWASVELSPMTNRNGEHIGYVQVLRDRTQQHLAGRELEQTQTSLRWAQEAGGVGVFHVDTEGTLHATPEFCRLYGVADCAAIPAAVFEELIVPEDRHLVSKLESRFAGTAPLDVEYRIRRADTGELRWIARTGQIQRDGAGASIGFAGVARDITEQRIARDALARSEERFQTIMATIEAAFAIVEVKFDADDRPVDYRFVEVNPAFERQSGVDLRGKWVTEFAPDLEQFWFDTYGHVAKTGEPTNFESYAEAFRRWFDVRAVRVGDPADRQIAIFFNDVTARREAEERLRASEALAREYVERVQLALDAGAIIGTWLWDLPSDQFTVDEGFARAFGLDPALGRQGIPLAQITATVHPDDHADLTRAIDEAIARGGSYAHQYRVRRADGQYYWIEANGRVDHAPDGTPTSFPGVLIDVEERRAAERRLRESEEQLRLATDAADIGLWDVDLVNDTLFWPPRVKAMFGISPDVPVTMQDYYDGLHPDDHERTAAAFLAATDPVRRPIYDVEYRTVGKEDGVVRWVAAKGRAVFDDAGVCRRVLGTAIDITRRKATEQALHDLNEQLEQRVAEEVAERARAEEALRQAQKMEAVGQLTGGIAHDFNNMLTGVIGNLDLIQRHIAAGRMDRLERYIDAASTSAQRAAALTSRLLAFGRRQSLDLKPTDANVLVRGMEDLLHRTLGEQVVVEIHLATDLWAALTDANQLESALLNLCINARDAMPGGGTLTIESANTHLDEWYVREHPGLAAGDYVVLSVSDTGTGMSAATIDKVFEPFFTTKPVGQGTGLGLSMIYGFARQAGGHVRIYSELARGTTVKLFAPRFNGEVEAAADAEAPTPMGAGETVMVVEDDASVRLIVLEVLEELGYQAVEAVDARSAIPVLESGRRIDLLVTDVGLPGMNGRQLAEVARQHRPDLKILFVTGYAENAAVRSGFLDAGMQMMTKPFAIDAIATKIRDILEQ